MSDFAKVWRFAIVHFSSCKTAFDTNSRMPMGRKSCASCDSGYPSFAPWKASNAHGREEDVADVRNLIGVQHERVDWPYVEAWCERHGTRALLDRLRQECILE